MRTSSSITEDKQASFYERTYELVGIVTDKYSGDLWTAWIRYTIIAIISAELKQKFPQIIAQSPG